MKSIIKIVLTLFIFCAFVFGQTNKQTVAIYMSGKEPYGAKGAHKILGAELAKEISSSDNYSAVDRTTYILEQINKELVYQQRSGAVSDGQMRKIGEQLGVQFICVMQISEVKGGSYLLEARIVDVETAEVQKVVSETSNLENAMEMQYIAEKIATQIVNKDIGFQSYIEALNKALENSFSLGYGLKFKGSMCDYNKRTNVIIEDNSGYYIGEFIRYSISEVEFDGYGMEIAGLGKYINNCNDCTVYIGNKSKNKKSGSGSCYNSDGDLIYRGNFSNDKPTDKYPSPNANVSKYKIISAPIMGGGYYIGEWEDCENKECKEIQAIGYGVYVRSNGDLEIGFAHKNGSQFTKIPYNFEQDYEQCKKN